VKSESSIHRGDSPFFLNFSREGAAIEILDDLREGHSLSGRKRELRLGAVYGRGFLVFLLYTMRRLDCRRCGVVAVEEVLGGDGKTHIDQSLCAFPSPLGAAAVMERDGGAFRTSWDTVFDAVEYVVTWRLEHRTLGQIDECGRNQLPPSSTIGRSK